MQTIYDYCSRLSQTIFDSCAEDTTRQYEVSHVAVGGRGADLDQKHVSVVSKYGSKEASTGSAHLSPRCWIGLTYRIEEGYSCFHSRRNQDSDGTTDLIRERTSEGAEIGLGE